MLLTCMIWSEKCDSLMNLHQHYYDCNKSVIINLLELQQRNEKSI